MKPLILIIEDNEQNLYLIQFLLEKHGLDIASARTGKEGIQMAINLQPQVILLDIQLPEMDGYAVAEALRQVEELKNTPIVAVTSYAMVGDKERIMAAGATDYIEKPIDPDSFADQIKKHLSG